MSPARAAPLLLLAAALGAQNEWRREPATGMTAGSSPQITYDLGRHRLVYLNGAVGSMQTWAGDGAGRRQGARAPGNPLSQPGFASLPRLGGCLLLGGVTTTGLTNATFAFDGRAWRAVTTAVQPPARWFSPLAFDSARQRVVLSGGETNAGLVN